VVLGQRLLPLRAVYNSSGQLGTGAQNNCSAPVQIGQANTWTQIAAGRRHTVALKT